MLVALLERVPTVKPEYRSLFYLITQQTTVHGARRIVGEQVYWCAPPPTNVIGKCCESAAVTYRTASGE